MKTLYDLLGAHPEDDAESLKSAFRKAVKETHPDVHPGDPNAPMRFRQLVRANAILSDAEQRAAYDQLLDFELRRTSSRSKRTIISAAAHKLAADAIAVVVLATAMAVGYVVFVHISKASVMAPSSVEARAREPAEIAIAAAERQPETIDPVEPRDRLEEAALPDWTIVMSAVAWPQNNGPALENAHLAPASELAATDAKSYRERGILSYRNGDFAAAIADFDLAIQLDPSFAAAYIDRGIAFYRLSQLDHAFADIAKAQKIEKAHTPKFASSKPRNTSSSPDKN